MEEKKIHLLYEGKDITEDVDILRCVHCEAAGGRSDGLHMELDHLKTWYAWQPKPDDKIIVKFGDYQTGILYLNTVRPDEAGYHIYATGMPTGARKTAWAYYEDQTLGAILAACAGECGMGHALFGVNTGIHYRYLLRENESGPKFLHRLLAMEGAVLKGYNSKMQAIGIEFAQGQKAAQKMKLDADQAGVRYMCRNDLKVESVTIRTAFGEGSAQDGTVKNGNRVVYTQLPAMDSGQAARWAKGILLSRNRRAEELTVETEFNPAFCAMERIDVESETETGGEWIVDTVEHDMTGNRSRATMLRCI